MPLTLAAATPMEMRRALGALGSQDLVPQRGWAKATLAGQEVILLVTGVGPINAALGLGKLLGQNFRLSGVLNLGLAGGFDLETTPLVSPIMADREICPEYGLRGEDGWTRATDIGFPQLVDRRAEVWDQIALDPVGAAQAMGLTLDPSLARGASVTVAGVTGGFHRAQELKTRYGAVSENMEGFSLALACLETGLPFLEIRTVSNLVGERDKRKWAIKEALTGLGNVLAGLLGHAARGTDPL